jgi:hypothetical protein
MKLLVVVAVVLAGLGLWRWSTEPPAAAATQERAVRLFNAMETYQGTTALDQAREAKRYGGVRILVARDTSAGREIVLAVTATSTHRTRFDLQFWPDADPPVYRATRCYRWTDDRAWDTADQVDCPAKREIDRSSGARPRPIPVGADRAVARALRGHPHRTGVQAALAGLDADVTEVDGTVAVAVAGVEGYDSGRPVNECLLGLRRGEAVHVWRPSSIQVAPGEMSCTAAAAFAPEMQHPPH